MGLGAGSGNSEAEASKQEKLIAELRVLRGTMAAELAKASGAPARVSPRLYAVFVKSNNDRRSPLSKLGPDTNESSG